MTYTPERIAEILALADALAVPPIYNDYRDVIRQGAVYTRHVMQMTGEKLHSKADIAQELAHRDIIAPIREALDNLIAAMGNP